MEVETRLTFLPERLPKGWGVVRPPRPSDPNSTDPWKDETDSGRSCL